MEAQCRIKNKKKIKKTQHTFWPIWEILVAKNEHWERTPVRILTFISLSLDLFVSKQNAIRDFFFTFIFIFRLHQRVTYLNNIPHFFMTLDAKRYIRNDPIVGHKNALRIHWSGVCELDGAIIFLLLACYTVFFLLLCVCCFRFNIPWIK